MPTGTAIQYVSSDGHLGLPRASDTTYRAAHKPAAPKPTGLNWDALRPKCKGCGEPSGQLDGDSICPACRGDIPAKRIHPDVTTARGDAYQALPEADLDAKFRGPGRAPVSVQDELDELEQPEPDVAAAAASYDDMVDRVTRPDDYAQPPAVTPFWDEAANLDAQVTHAARVLRDTYASTHPAVRLLRASTIAALEALHLLHELHPQTPAAAPPSPRHAAAGPTSAAGQEGEASRKPAPRRHVTAAPKPVRPRRTSPNTRNPVDETAIVTEYQAGDSAPDIARRHGCGAKRIREILDRHGVQRRDDRATRSGGVRKADDPAFVEQVRDLYARQGLTQSQTAQRLGCSEKVIWRIVTRTPDIEARPSASALSAQGIGRPNKIPAEDHQKIIDRYTGGESAPAIAQDYGCTATSIYAFLRKHGINERHGVRTSTTGRGDHAKALRALMDAHGITSHQVKTWALEQGLISQISRGIPRQQLVHAYLNAHTTTPQGATA